MAFIVRKHDTGEVYDLLCNFWNQHGFPEIGLDFLPKNTFIAYADEKPIYSMCFYFTECKRMAWIGWPVSNKKVDYRLRSGGLTVLLNRIEEYAKKKGVKMLFTTSSNTSIISELEKCEFVKGDSGVDHLYKLI